MKEIKEEWRDVKGFEGIYEVSNKGFVRSLTREVIRKDGIKMVRKGKAIRGGVNSAGYHVVQLHLNGKKLARLTHALVMESFVGPRKKGQEVNHVNGDKTDNRIENLEYCTRSENIKHAYRIGLCENTRAKHKEGLGSRRIVLLNTETGVFYASIREAAEAHDINPGTLRQRVRGISPNHTPFVVVGKTVKGKFIKE